MKPPVLRPGPNFWDITWARKFERYNRRHQSLWEAVMEKMNGRVVDLGCGPCVMYEGKTVDLTGVDWSAEALNQARLHYPEGKYVHASALNSGLPSGQYDTVIMLGLLDYFEDWTPVVEEARRLVAPGGAIFATLLNGFNYHDWHDPYNAKAKVRLQSYRHVTSNWYLAEISTS